MSNAYITRHCVLRGTSADPRSTFQEIYAREGIAYPKFYKMDGLSQLGFLATEMLLRGVSLDYAPEDVGVVLSNANASLDTDIRYYRTVGDGASPALFVYTLPNIMIGEICIRHGFKGENSFFVFKAFHPTFMQGYVEGLVKEGLVKACVCGWVEVLGEAYDAALFLVERSGTIECTVDNLNELYHG